MSASGLADHMRRQAMLARAGFSDPQLGVVTSLDTANYCVKVRIEPDNVETGWLPIASQWVGAGWGMFAPLPVGTQVQVIFSEANPEIGIVTGALFHDGMRPQNCPEGEFWLVHADGATVKLLNGGDLRFTHPDGSELHFQQDGKVFAKAPGGFELEGDANITGALTVTGNITDNTPGNSVTVKALRDAYNAHMHGGVQTGGGTTSTTTNPAV